MTQYFAPVIAIALGISALIWSWDSLHDPKTKSITCLRDAMPKYLQQVDSREAGGEMMSMLNGVMNDAESAFEPCRENVQRWAARDGEMPVKRGIARVVLTSFAEETDDDLARRFAQGMIRKIDEADARQ